MTDICSAEIFTEGWKIKSEGNYIDHTKDSLWTYYSIDGNITTTEFYLKGKKKVPGKFIFRMAKSLISPHIKADVKSGVLSKSFMKMALPVNRLHEEG